ncbi:MAG: tandem-95 repeat protein [Chitinispirillaceae bacterium]|nr:tandem-95 repeat protein [Chitinispirillaceae bacterium]
MSLFLKSSGGGSDKESITDTVGNTDTVVITVSAAPVNRPPFWNPKTVSLSGRTGSEITLSLSDICADPDSDAVAFILLEGDPGADTIIDSIWLFTPAGDDTGNYTLRVTASDPDGATDTLTVTLSVSIHDSTIVDNSPPVIKLISPVDDTVIGVDSFRVSVLCTDQSGVASVTIGTGGSTVEAVNESGNLYSATIKELPGGEFSTVMINATDGAPTPNTGTATVRIKNDDDTAKPVITRVTPPADSVSTNAVRYTVTLSCTDQSGIVSVVGEMDEQSFTGARAEDNHWTIAVTGLTENAVNAVTVTATDSSLRANSAQLIIFITCDPTMEDSDGPTIIQISGPTNDDIVSDSVVEITDSIIDPSGIDSVYWTLNGDWAGTLASVSESSDAYRLRDTLTSYHEHRIVIHAIDNASRHNRDSAVITVDYDAAPAVNDTGISTDKNRNVSFTLVAESPDGDPLVWTKLSDPSRGTVTGTLPEGIYAPADGFSGTDTFFVQVSDEVWSDTAEILFLVREVNYPPVLNDSAITISEDSPATFNLSGSDPDGDALVEWSIVKQGSDGTATLGSSPANRVTYTPTDDFAGRDTFSVRAGDGDLYDTGFIWVTVTPVNDVPTISRNLGLTVLEGGNGTINTSRLNFIDPDNSTSDLSITVTALTENGQLALSGVPVTASGILTYDDLASGNFTYTHNGDEAVADSFSYTVSDGEAEQSGRFKFTISPVNDAPTFSKHGSQMKNTVGQGNFYRDTVIVSDPEGAYSTMSVTMVPVDAGVTFSTANGRVVIRWLADFTRYSCDHAVSCTLEVVDGANAVLIAWTTTVGKHVWTKVMNGSEVEDYMYGSDIFAPRDSFIFFTANSNPSDPLQGFVYKCDMKQSSPWTTVGTVLFWGAGIRCNTTTVCFWDGNRNIYRFNATTGTLIDSFTNAYQINGWALAESGSDVYYTRTTSGDSTRLFRNGTAVHSMDNSSDQRSLISPFVTQNHTFVGYAYTSTTTHIYLSRLTNPLPNPNSFATATTAIWSGTIGPGSQPTIAIRPDNNDNDTIYAFRSGSVKRFVNYVNSTSPAVETVTGASAPNEIKAMVTGSAGWFKTGTETDLYFTSDAFATSITESFDPGYTVSDVKISADGKAVFAIGSDYTIYRY